MSATARFPGFLINALPRTHDGWMTFIILLLVWTEVFIGGATRFMGNEKKMEVSS